VRIKSVKAENFLSYRKLDFEIGTGITAIVGENRDNPGSRSNGAGKTGFIDAISWALFGETTRGLSGDDVINDALKKGTRGEVEFSDGTKVIRYRKYPKLKNSVVIIRNGEESQFDRMKDAQDQIELLLGVDWLAFRQSVLFGQDAVRFLGLPDAEKKAVIERILGVSAFDQAAELARKEVREQISAKKQHEQDAEILMEKQNSACREANARRDSLEELRGQNEEEQKRVNAEIEQKQNRLAEFQKTGDIEAAEAELGQLDSELVELKKQEKEIRAELVETETALQADKDDADDITHKYREACAERDALVQKIEIKTEALQSRESEKRDGVANAEAELEDLETGFKTLCAELEAGKTKAETELATIKAEIETKSGEVRKADNAVAALRAKVDECRERCDALGKETERRRAEHESASKQIDALTGIGNCCPTCQQAVPDAHVKRIGSVLRQRLTKIESVLDDVGKKLETAKAEHDKAVADLDSAQTSDDIKADIAGLRSAAKHIESVIADFPGAMKNAERDYEDRVSKVIARIEKIEAVDIEAEKAEIDGFKTTEAEIASRVGKLGKKTAGIAAQIKTRSEALRAVKTRWDDLQATLETASARRAEAAQKVAVLTERKSLGVKELQTAIEGLQNRLQTLRNRKFDSEVAEIDKIDSEAVSYSDKATEAERLAGKAESRIDALSFWVDAFGLRGIRSMLLDGVLPFLEERMNTYLETLTGGTIKVGLSALSETKSGKVKDSFGVEIASTSSGSKYKGLSGGERQRVDISFAMALFDLARSRAGVDFGLAVFDEVFERVDDAGQESVTALLRKEAPRWGSVLLVTHLDGLLSSVRNRIRVVKEGGESRIEN